MRSDPATPPRSPGWTAATRLADGLPDDGSHRRRTRALIWAGVLVLIAWAAGVALALILPTAPHGVREHDDSTARLIAQFVLLALGCIVGGVGFALAYRTGHYITRWTSVVGPSSPAEKRSLRRQIAGREPLDEQHADVVVAIAAQGRKATFGVVPIYAAVMLFAAATAVNTDSVIIRLLEVFVSACMVLVFVQIAVGYRRSGRFLAMHERR